MSTASSSEMQTTSKCLGSQIQYSGVWCEESDRAQQTALYLGLNLVSHLGEEDITELVHVSSEVSWDSSRSASECGSLCVFVFACNKWFLLHKRQPTVTQNQTTVRDFNPK